MPQVIGCRESDSAAVVVTVKEGGAAKRAGARPGMVLQPLHSMSLRPGFSDSGGATNQRQDHGRLRRRDRPGAQAVAANDDRLRQRGGQVRRCQASESARAVRRLSAISVRTVHRPAFTEAVARGAIAERWAAIKAEHRAHSEARLNVVRQGTRADVAQHDLDSIVAQRVKHFMALFDEALREAGNDARVLNERNPQVAAAERVRRRAVIDEQWRNDRAARRAPRPRFENVAGSPDELVIQVSSPALAPVGPSRRDDAVLFALVDVSDLDASIASARKWIRYDSPIRITKPGKYAILTKMVPGDDDAATAPPEAASTIDRPADEAIADAVLYESCELESQVATAVYELGESPPLMQYEECPRELAYVPRLQADARRLVCVKCGGLASSDRKLYARGDYCICRACALKGAGVMIDPGARRMWFSKMISFVGNRAIPLQRSQPLLTQILRVMQSASRLRCAAHASTIMQATLA